MTSTGIVGGKKENESEEIEKKTKSGPDCGTCGKEGRISRR
jgi:hypothetical protein